MRPPWIVAASAGLLLLAQCNTLHSPMTSRIEGLWAREEGRAVWDELGKPKHEEQFGASDGPELGIRKDGTFNWSYSMLAFLGQNIELKKVGDSIRTPPELDGSQFDGKLTVLSSTYTPEHSRIRMRFDAKGGFIPSEIIYEAKERADGKIDFRLVARESTRGSAMSAIMKRYVRNPETRSAEIDPRTPPVQELVPKDSTTRASGERRQSSDR